MGLSMSAMGLAKITAQGVTTQTTFQTGSHTYTNASVLTPAKRISVPCGGKSEHFNVLVVRAMPLVSGARTTIDQG
jgi:hypothetical protein